MEQQLSNCRPISYT